MEGWKSVCLAILLCSLASGLYRLFGKNHPYEKQVNFVISLLTLSLLVTPLLTFPWSKLVTKWEGLEDVPPKEETDAKWEEALLSQSQSKVQEQVEALLYRRFSLTKQDSRVVVQMNVQTGQIYLKSLQVTLSSQNAYMKKDIETYLERVMAVTVTVTVKE